MRRAKEVSEVKKKEKTTSKIVWRYATKRRHGIAHGYALTELVCAE